jgi:hypothetical protein
MILLTQAELIRGPIKNQSYRAWDGRVNRYVIVWGDCALLAIRESICKLLFSASVLAKSVGSLYHMPEPKRAQQQKREHDYRLVASSHHALTRRLPAFFCNSSE